MYYPRFTKAIIHHFHTKDKFISMRNRMFMHTARDDSIFGTMRFVSKYEDTRVYGALLPKAMTNQAMLDYESYMTYYAIATGAEPPKSKKIQKKCVFAISSKETPSKKKPAKSKKDVPQTKKPATKPKPTKKMAPVKAVRGKGDGTNFELGVLDEQQYKISSTDEGTGTKRGVPNVPKYDYESEKESWGNSEEDDEEDSEDESDDDKGNDDDGDNDDNDDDSDDERTESDKDENPNLNQTNEEHEEEEEEKEYVNERGHNPKNYELTDEEDNTNNAKEENEEEEDDVKE
ncbi:hypothetical protein Tco_1347286 [Tanacetum coccineum]